MLAHCRPYSIKLLVWNRLACLVYKHLAISLTSSLNYNAKPGDEYKRPHINGYSLGGSSLKDDWFECSKDGGFKVQMKVYSIHNIVD